MDPNANLREQDTCTDPRRLRELRQALLAWISSGGFAPDWEAYPSASRDFRSWVSHQRLSSALVLGRVRR